MQRRQMTTAAGPNVHNLAIAGTFDGCRATVKAFFADPALRDEIGLAAVNSINWARVAVQTAYYTYAALALGAPAPARLVHMKIQAYLTSAAVNLKRLAAALQAISWAIRVAGCAVQGLLGVCRDQDVRNGNVAAAPA